MNFSQRMCERAKKNPKTIVFPEGTDLRILQAARFITDEKMSSGVTLLGNTDQVRNLALRTKVNLDGLTILDPERSPELGAFAAEYYELRKHKGMSTDEARKEIVEPLKFGAMMVRLGRAHAMVGGAVHATADLLRAAITIIKTSPGTKTASSCFVMYLPGTKWGADGHFIFSDCGTIPDPTAEELSEISISAARSCRDFLDTEPIVAMLSFSSYGSATHPSVEKVRKALELVREKQPSLIIDGEMQADAALVPEVARAKVPGSKVGGKANVLIFPDLNAGNIAYKLVQRLAGAEAYGPLLQGFAKPVSDLSRGCVVDDIVSAAAVTLVQAQNSK
jgi:phosphate acetyltransferase